MKLEVGKWCRTKKGTIFKIIGGNVDMWEIDIDYSYLSKCENEDYNSYAYNKNNSLFEYLVVKTSYNIIDILEVGDYVNGLKVIDIVENDIYISDYYAESYIGIVKVKDIKSIVTHEQMEQMAYKVEKQRRKKDEINNLKEE
jgi:hypothetical protein